MLEALSLTLTCWLQSKDGAWQSKAATEWRTLRQVQGELEMEKGQAVFLGTSLAATVRKCIHLGDRRSANKLRDKFHISERRFAWLVVRHTHKADMAACLRGVRKVNSTEDACAGKGLPPSIGGCSTFCC